MLLIVNTQYKPMGDVGGRRAWGGIGLVNKENGDHLDLT